MTLRRFRPQPFRLTTALFVVALLTSACASGDEPTVEPPEATDAAAFNDADISFLQGMIPHHQQAVAMAELVTPRTQRPELLALAENIITTQQQEISLMEALLDQAGASPAGSHGDMDGMEGMMDDSELGSLRAKSGTDFDLAFIDMMTRHHQGAVDAAQAALVGGVNAEVASLARAIVDAQNAEIDQMRQWREQWAD